MPIAYVAKRLIRSWQLYIALLLGILLASTFFAGVNVGAYTAAKQALDQQLNQIPVDFFISGYALLSPQNITKLLTAIDTVPEVVQAEPITRGHINMKLPDEDYPGTYRLVGITPNSKIYHGWTTHPESIAENETYIPAGSPLSKKLKTGDKIQINMTTFMYTGDPRYGEPQLNNTNNLILNLTVAGFAQLNDASLALAQGYYYSYSSMGFYMGPGQIVNPTPIYIEDMFIVDQEKTLNKFLNIFYQSRQYQFQTDIAIYINRNAIINIWDIPGSVDRLEVIKRKINNQISIAGFGLETQSALQSILFSSQMMVSMMRLVFVGVSLPVFFVAWYMGTTVSDVSFNLRRREIGLLLTKGFSRSQLFRMFLTEAIIIGIIAGIAGILLSLALVPVFAKAVGGEFTTAPVIGIDTMIMTIIFSLTLVILAIFRPARRASNLATIDALREYMLVEDVKPYKKRLPWIAFILGTYKLIVLALGINLMNEIPRLAMGGTNFLLVILLALWAVFDATILLALGPVLFFWGFTKIFIRGSLKFQEITARAAKFLGDLGTLATRNVRRNPARAASVAFLISTIIWYGIQTTGTLASDQDYYLRSIYAAVGSDIRIDVPPPANISITKDLIKTINSSVTGIASMTSEYQFYGVSSFGTFQLMAINASEWRNTAYYEDTWFSGNDVNTAFQNLQSNDHAIILDKDVAERNSLHLGDGISIILGYDVFGAKQITENLTIAGFFGFKRPDTTMFGPAPSMYTLLSYVPDQLFYELRPLIANVSTTRILTKLTAQADANQTAEEIKTLMPAAATLYSVSEQIQLQQSNLMYTGTLNVQRLGVAFAIVAASVGTALVSFVSLKERQREASMMSVRGLSFKQLTVMLLTENLAVIVFAVLIGAIAGLLIVYGNVASSTSTTVSLVTRRLVFPPDALLTIFTYIALVFASTIIPVIIMSRRFISRLDRVVRQA